MLGIIKHKEFLIAQSTKFISFYNIWCSDVKKQRRLLSRSGCTGRRVVWQFEQCTGEIVTGVLVHELFETGVAERCALRNRYEPGVRGYAWNVKFNKTVQHRLTVDQIYSEMYT